MKRKCALTVGYYKRFVAVSIHIKCNNFSTFLANEESFIKAYDGCYQTPVWWTPVSDLSRTKCNETRSILWHWSSLELELITTYSSTGLSTSYIVYTNLMTIIIVINIIITHADWLTEECSLPLSDRLCAGLLYACKGAHTLFTGQREREKWGGR